MEEIDQELMKHICKFCNKRFLNGRSLGGHMRSHVINSTDHHHHHHDYLQHQVKIRSCSSVLDKLCKVCGKGFQSWKALFGHMKCHSTKLLNNQNKSFATLNQDSFTGDSDNENSDVKDRRIKRSRSRSRNMRNKRSVATTGLATDSSSISMNAFENQISTNDASTSTVSEIEKEQETVVALSLMMLSRDSGKWGHEIESSGNCNSSVLVNLCKTEVKDVTESGSKTSNCAGTQVNIDFIGKAKVSMVKSFELDSGFGQFEDLNKRKFDCVACNKSFHSFQALGGHKASHKKLKKDFDSKTENENKIKYKPTSDHELTINGHDPNRPDDHQESSSSNLGIGFLKKKTVALGAHECPICFKIFSSGQALGGHKRSHLNSEAKFKQENYTRVIKKPDEQVHETHRMFLDLNMPPEEEMNMNSTEYKSYYWEDSSDHHSHESRLLGLISTT
ncbi:zinc finger protein ZAT9-like [Rutidosis leptorrhynchoides]|uniref:zinc finger protein ZAT9-like n=1 Tax=Rutidosis leptorrhynchoides TaxID=125765 RepID=UPI003A9A4B2D